MTALARLQAQASSASLMAKPSKQVAAQVPKSGLFFFGFQAAKLLGVEWNAAYPVIGKSLLDNFKSPLLKKVEQKVKGAGYTRVIRPLARLFIDEDVAKLTKAQIRYGFTYAELAILNEIVTALKSGKF